MIRYRLLLGLAVLCLISTLSASAAVPATAPADTAVYPGAKLTFQVNLTDKDFLPAIKQFLPTVPGIIGAHAGQSVPEGPAQACIEKMSTEDFAKELMAAISGLKRVTVSGYSVKAADPEKVTQFYTQKLGLTKGWSPTLVVNVPPGAVRLYVRPDLEEIFGFFVSPNQFFTIRTSGKIDLARIMKVAGELAPLAMSVRTQVDEVEADGMDHDAVPGNAPQPAQQTPATQASPQPAPPANP